MSAKHDAESTARGRLLVDLVSTLRRHEFENELSAVEVVGAITIVLWRKLDGLREDANENEDVPCGGDCGACPVADDEPEDPYGLFGGDGAEPG